MKTLKLLFVLPAIMALQTAFAQQAGHLTLSDQYPAAGETITLTYDPAGTALDGKTGITGKVYNLDNKTYPVTDIRFIPDGKLLKSSFKVPDSTKAFFVKLYKDDAVDNNNDEGYVYLVYKGNKPVQGAYASEAYMLSSGMGTQLATIKRIDNSTGVALYNKEFDIYPESKDESYGTNYYYLLTRSTDPASITIINDKIAQLEKSGTETNLSIASALLNYTQRKTLADSLKAAIKSRYPNGDNVKSEKYGEFFAAMALSKKDSIFQAFVKQFPDKPQANGFSYNDQMAAQLAEAYSKTGDWVNSDKYVAAIKNSNTREGTLNDVAYEMAKKGENLDEAAKMSKESLDLIQKQLNDPQPAPYSSVTDVKASNKILYGDYADTYALILIKQKRFAEALKYEQPIYDQTPLMDAEEMEHYMTILNALGKYKQAKLAGENDMKAGKSSEIIEHELKISFIKSNGSDKGYDTYLASLKNFANDQSKAELAKTMINQPAPQFTLKDLDGKTISLADLKGKVVIVDFWATWCGPCKASFPGMQMAVNKYKDDPNVNFVFVDCWETSPDITANAVKFITDKQYTFHVLIDEKGSDGKQSKVVTSYGVDGIPTKFIIDKNGNIRFKFVGYTGNSPDALAADVSNMIDMAADPGSISAAPTKGTSN